jgi:hypothetical protein
MTMCSFAQDDIEIHMDPRGRLGSDGLYLDLMEID